MARDGFRAWNFGLPEEDDEPIAKSVVASSPLYRGLASEDFENIPQGTGARLRDEPVRIALGSGVPAAAIDPMVAPRQAAARERQRVREAERARVRSLPTHERIATADARRRARGDRTGISGGEIAQGVFADIPAEIAERTYGLFDDDYAAAEVGNRVHRAGGRLVAGMDRMGDLGLLDEEYSPVSMASGAIPFFDEAVAAGVSATGPETYRDAQERFERETNDARERYPGSAMVGAIGQGIVATPFLRVPRVLSAALPVTAGAGRVIGQAVGRGAVESAQLGALQAADRSEASPLGVGIDVARGRTSPELGLPQLGQEALTFAGDVQRGARDEAIVGGAFGGGLGLGQTALRRMLVRPADVARRSASEAASIDRAVREATSAPDEFELDMMGRALEEDPNAFIPRDILGAQIPDIRNPNAASLVREEPVTAGGILRGLFRRRPDVERMRAMGLNTQGQLQGAINVYGPEGLSRRADLYGIMREGELGAEEGFVARATALRERAGADLRALADRASSEGIMIDGDWLADQLQAQANEYRAIRDESYQEAANALENQIRTLRPEMEAIDVAAIADDIARPVQPPNPTIVERVPFGEEMGRPTVRDTMPMGQRVARDARRAMNAQTVAEASPYGQRITPEWEALPEAEGVEMLPDEMLPEAEGVEFLGLADEPMGTPTSLATRPRADATSFRRPTLIPWAEYQAMMRSQAGRNRGIYRGTVTNPDVSAEAGRRAYRLMNEARDRAIGARYGDEALGDYRSLRDQYATAATIAPQRGVTRGELSQPTLRRAYGAMTGAGLGGTVHPALAPLTGLMGYALGNRLPAYEHSILAAVNRPGVSLSSAGADMMAQVANRLRGRPAYAGLAPTVEQAPAIIRAAEAIGDSETARAAADMLNVHGAIDALPNLARRIDEIARVNPDVFGAHAGEVRTMVARGLTVNDLLDFYRRDPNAAMDVESVVRGDDAPAPEIDPMTGEFVDDEPEPVEESASDIDPMTGEFIEPAARKSGRTPHLTEGGR